MYSAVLAILMTSYLASIMYGFDVEQSPIPNELCIATSAEQACHGFTVVLLPYPDSKHRPFASWEFDS